VYAGFPYPASKDAIGRSHLPSADPVIGAPFAARRAACSTSGGTPFRGCRLPKGTRHAGAAEGRRDHRIPPMPEDAIGRSHLPSADPVIGAPFAARRTACITSGGTPFRGCRLPKGTRHAGAAEGRRDHRIPPMPEDEIGRSHLPSADPVIGAPFAARRAACSTSGGTPFRGCRLPKETRHAGAAECTRDFHIPPARMRSGDRTYLQPIR